MRAIAVNRGDRYARLVVVKELEARNRRRTFRVKCDCGTTLSVLLEHMRSGNTKSCGCYANEVSRVNHTKHGESHTVLYKRWRDMLRRCYETTRPNYHRYGGRGITVCAAWRTSYENFRDWAHLNGYAPSLELERTNNNRGYSPANCCWATRREQVRNTSVTIRLRFKGHTYSLADAVDKFAVVGYHTAKGRIQRGWSAHAALLTPPIDPKTRKPFWRPDRPYLGNST